MDYRKTNAPSNTITRDMMKLSADTGNVYETVAIIGKRSNQIAVEMKQDLEKKLQEFASFNDNLEEVFENREQIEISRYYEKLPKPTLIAAQEYEEGKVYYKNPAKEKNNFWKLKLSTRNWKFNVSICKIGAIVQQAIWYRLIFSNCSFLFNSRFPISNFHWKICYNVYKQFIYWLS